VALAAVVAIVVALFAAAFGAGGLHARQPQVFGGSLVLDDDRPLTVVDVGTAAVTVRLQGVYQQVGAKSYADVEAVPLSSGTALVNRQTGTFNLLGEDNYVLDTAGPGVGLGPLPGLRAASALADGSSAFIIRYAPHSTVSLVDAGTVAAANRSASSGSSRAVAPEGFAQLPGSVPDRPGAAVVSDGDLWALVQSGPDCALDRLHPQAGARNGLARTVVVARAGSCSATALEALPGAGAPVLAQPGRVERFGEGKPTVTVPVPALSGVSTLLPVSFSADLTPGTPSTVAARDRSASGVSTAWWLALGRHGWSVVGLSPANQVTPVRAVAGLGPRSRPAAPAESAGSLYTLDQAASGQPKLEVIDPQTGGSHAVVGMARYPARSRAERAGFEGAEVVVDGPRVVYNNPQSLLAAVVFTDGSHAPVIVDKSAALSVSAVGPGAVAGGQAAPVTTGAGLEGSKASAPTTTPPLTVPVAQPVSQQVTCANTTQKPYAPVITSVVASGNSALVSWAYHLLDQTDCQPDSWSVAVTPINGAPAPARPLQTVNGQEQLEVTGLHPGSSYQVVVTAYLNTESTASSPATFTTSSNGPEAPTAVHTVADGHGGWVVSWVPCSGAACYLADTWTVTGTGCGAGQFIGQPPSVQVPGDQTSVSISAAQLGLLGDALSFSVVGSASGLNGDPASDGACTQAWQPPNAATITLSASGTVSADGQSITATLTVAPTGAPAQAYGASSAVFVYSVGGVTVGPTNATTVTVPGLPAGGTFTPTVAVYPAGHPQAAVTVTGQPFSQTIAWPSTLTMAVEAHVAPDPNSGSLAVAFAGLPTGSYAASGQLVCASTGLAVNGPLVGNLLVVAPINLDAMGGQCSLDVSLKDTAVPNPYGVVSPTMSAQFTIGQLPAYSFGVSAGPGCARGCTPGQVVVSFGGPQEPRAGTDWVVTIPGGGGCAVTTPPTKTPAFPLTVSEPANCGLPVGDEVTVSYEYLGQTVAVPAGAIPAPVGPAPPGGASTTLPGASTTLPGGSTTLPSVTVTLPGSSTSTTSRPALTTTTTTAPASTTVTTAGPTTSTPASSTPPTSPPTTSGPLSRPGPGAAGATESPATALAAAVTGAAPAGAAGSAPGPGNWWILPAGVCALALLEGWLTIRNTDASRRAKRT
jgi:hypothetical protein